MAFIVSRLKDVVGKLFGFEKDLQELRQQVETLKWDSAFGMWTRGAFLQFCYVMPRHVRTVAFIDLDKIHTLNQEYGYSEVDKRVKATFSITFRRSDVVARWFSGDEIVILFDSDRIGAERKMENLQESAQKQGLTFKYEIGTWEVGIEPIETVVEGLTEKLALQKSESAR